MILNLEAGSVYLVVVRDDDSYSFVRLLPKDVFRKSASVVAMDAIVPAIYRLRHMEGDHVVANATP